MKPTIDWTDARIEELLTLWRQGLTASEISGHFGVTRNAICGKLFRLRRDRGLVSPHRRVTRRTPSPTDKPRSKRAMFTLPESAGSVSAYVSPPLPVPDLGQLASIVDVTGCRWPVRDDAEFVGGQAFCNHAQADGSAYCPYHRRESVADYSRKLIRQTIRSAIHLYTKAAA